jgi:hypothetical protein
MNGYMSRLDKNQIRLYTDWDSSVGWGWGMTSTIRVFKDGFKNKSKHQTIHQWLYK